MQASRPTMTLERTFKATVEEVWDLWTTKNGIESWWGPEGFATEVHGIDLRPGGQLDYSMIAVAPDQIEFLRKAGMPASTPVRVTFTEVVPHRRIAYISRTDFIPGVEPYDVITVVELHAVPGGVRMVLILEAMHDENWTNMAVMGWESQLGRLERVVEASKS